MALLEMEFDEDNYKSVTITAGTNITLNNSNCYRYGKMVIVTVRFTTTAAISTNHILFSGIPNPAANVYFNIGNGYNSNIYGARTGNDKVYANGAIPSGAECNASFAYISY